MILNELMFIDRSLDFINLVVLLLVRWMDSDVVRYRYVVHSYVQC